MRRSARSTPVYIVAGIRPWNEAIFRETISRFPGEWHFAGRRADLTLERVRALQPRYIFFLHWAWKVPPEIVNDYECVCFHMTDVPFGRGGSPLQNLVLRGHGKTMLTALRMVEELDAGPIYMKEELSIEGGTAEEIYVRATRKAAGMIRRMIADSIQPVPQQGKPTVFRRRRPDESEIPTLEDLGQVHDFIRMLDAEGYPRSFLCHKGFRYTFSQAARYHDRIQANVTITPMEKEQR